MRRREHEDGLGENVPNSEVREVDIKSLQYWVKQRESRIEVIGEKRARQFAATIGLDWIPRSGDKLPLPWHWLYFQPETTAARTGHDGHEVKDGAFLPPVPLSRRMWAAGNVEVTDELLAIGDEIQKDSIVTEISSKQGQSGPLVFVKINHRYVCKDTIALQESQTIVYRDNAGAAESRRKVVSPEEPAADWSANLIPDPVLLFRYSALTFNSHRIHYDRHYAKTSEGYEDLVVQGPLTVSLLLNRFREEQPDANIIQFSFRGISPLFVNNVINLRGTTKEGRANLWANDHNGQRAMEVRCSFS